jgi:hypothetical protein
MKEYHDDSTLRIRFLEKELKLLQQFPSWRQAIRPNLPDFPYEIDFVERDTHLRRLKFRCLHQLNLVKGLSL